MDIYLILMLAEMGVLKMSIKDKTTFWELLEEYEIEIPVIQRDYAQGRDNEIDIRNNFLESIKEALENKTDLDLNFVYGSKSNGKFIPIDGQQRLTTLYLLHLYILIVLEKNMSKGSNMRITKFSYETRASSKDFCKKLTSEKLTIQSGKTFNEVECLSKEITNNNWFSSSWRYDPTIKSMLNMLDAIHRFFRFSNLNEFYDLLTGNSDYDCPLFFYFLDLGEYNLNDSIYIKLNARGKDLTCYENFKAKLSKYINDEISEPEDDYIAKLDGKWSDVFWQFRDSDTKLYDEKIMNLFVNYMINEYAAYMKTVGRDPIRDEIKTVMSYSHLEFINHFKDFNDKWDNNRVIDSFINAFLLFDLITNEKELIAFVPNNPYFDEKRLFRYVIDNKETEKESKTGISYPTRVLADAYFGFVLTNRNHIDNSEEFGEKLKEWMRVISTLSRETNFNAGDDFVRAIKGIRRLLPYSFNILEHLNSIDDRTGYGFDYDCFEEECIKAKLMLRNNEWRNIILSAENNKYFNGQIGFLLEGSDIITQYENGVIDDWSNEDEEKYKNAINKYYSVFNKIFGEFKYEDTEESYIGINREFANVFRRALLCKGDYLLIDSSNSSFLIDFSRDISWKRLLRIQSNDKSGLFKKKRGMLLELLNDSLFDSENIKTSLEKICERDGKKITDWRRYFIVIPEIMDSLHTYNSYKQPRERFIRIEGDNIFLMGTTRLYGYNDEYYSFALYWMIKKCLDSRAEKIDVVYEQAKGWESIHHQIQIKNKLTGSSFSIKYERESKQYKMIDEFENITVYQSPEEVIDALSATDL